MQLKHTVCVFSCTLNKATSTSTWSSAISRAEKKRTERQRERKRGGVGEEKGWKPTLEELNYQSLFSLSFSRLLWPTSKRWCSHDPAQYTDILFNPASMKFLQIKPLCRATANYLTDWPPSGSGYSVEWPCFTPHSPPPTQARTPPALPPRSLPILVQRGATLTKSQRASFFSGDYIFLPPLPSQPSIHPKSGERDVCVCVQMGVLCVSDSSHFIV